MFFWLHTNPGSAKVVRASLGSHADRSAGDRELLTLSWLSSIDFAEMTNFPVLTILANAPRQGTSFGGNEESGKVPGKENRPMRWIRMGLGVGVRKGPPTIPSLPNGPEVLFFSPKVEDTRNLGWKSGECKFLRVILRGPGSEPESGEFWEDG